MVIIVSSLKLMASDHDQKRSKWYFDMSKGFLCSLQISWSVAAILAYGSYHALHFKPVLRLYYLKFNQEILVSWALYQQKRQGVMDILRLKLLVRSML